MKHVIIGAGPAGVVAAETLRRLDPGAQISIVGDEPEVPYSRMAIPYYLIEQIPEQGTHLRKREGHFERHNIELRPGRVSRLEAGARQLQLEDGARLDYDRLLIATGSQPVRPPIPGMDNPKVHSCWTLADARAIVAGARPGSRVVLMGAGFIGCIILEALASRGVGLTVVEMENRMVPRMMNDVAGTLIKQWCQAKGVDVRTSAKVTSIEGGGPLRVSLESGEGLETDLVICATGVRPNTGFLEGSGLEIGQGIKVDSRLETNLEGVYAAGDVAEGLDFSTGGYSVQAIQPTATEHGRIAATNMAAGHELSYPGSINMNVLDTLGLISASFGSWQGVAGGSSAELSDLDGYRYLNLQFEEDRLVGASSLGLTEHVGVLRGLIQSRARLGVWLKRLKADPTRIMEAYLGTQGQPAAG